MEGFLYLQDLTYYIFTYGCQMNVHDSERVAGLLNELGFVKADDKKDAMLLIINTCCVRESAEKKILGHIGALKHLITENPKKKLLVCGCMIEQEYIREHLKNRFHYVHGVFSLNDLDSLRNLVATMYTNPKRQFALDYRKNIVNESSAFARNSYPISYVNIMYGCNNYCSYCIVPYVRGAERSREEGSIISEIKSLADEGYKEVTLLGQNVNSYGQNKNDFTKLLYRIAEETNMPRLRFMTSHPKDLTDELIAVYKDIHNLCKNMHLPVQAGSDEVLKLMNRKYTKDKYLELIYKLREACPGITITTDVIVGFPGENDKDFEDTLSLVKKAQFDSMYTFMYSKRSGTVAATMDNQVAQSVKKERIARLIEMQNEITFNKNKELENTYCKVLVESVSVRSEKNVCGRNDGGKIVNFAGDKSLIGEIVDVKITKAMKSTLKGELHNG